MRRPILLTALAAGAIAVPATALAADTFERERVSAADAKRAVAAAKRAVPAGANVIKVERDRDTGDRKVYEVELRTSTTEYDVELDRRFRVIDVDRDRLDGRGDSGGSDDDHDGDDHSGSGHGGSGRDHPEDD